MGGAAAKRVLAGGLLIAGAVASGGGLAAGAPVPAAPAARRFPHLLLITVDTLRADRLSSYGYRRPTTPNLDALLAGGARFAAARAVEPLTAPAITSLLTSLPPHEHGATRNGLPMRPELPSWPRTLARRGYRTAAFVGNWTLRERLSGLQEHFGAYRTITSRRRWLGLLKGEATAEDLNEAALGWLRERRENEPERPVLLWVHYVEPHAPYRLQETEAARLGIAPGRDGEVGREDRYDSEVAFVDRRIGELLAGWRKLVPASAGLVVFTADHGENLGEHGYWGHGRHLWEESLRVPFGLVWPGRVPARVIAEPVTTVDLGPTVLGLLGLPPPSSFRGRDLGEVLGAPQLARGEQPKPAAPLCFQAHAGAVQSVQDAQRARRKGLLQVGMIAGSSKEVLRLGSGQLWRYDLERDPRETAPPLPAEARPSAALAACLEEVRRGLAAADNLPAPPVDEETLEQLRALGYIDD